MPFTNYDPSLRWHSAALTIDGGSDNQPHFNFLVPALFSLPQAAVALKESDAGLTDAINARGRTGSEFTLPACIVET